MEVKNPSTFDKTIVATKKAIDSIYDFFSKIKNLQHKVQTEKRCIYF